MTSCLKNKIVGLQYDTMICKQTPITACRKGGSNIYILVDVFDEYDMTTAHHFLFYKGGSLMYI